MKHLLVLRHAKSSWKDFSLSDFDRPLNKRGYKDAPRMGSWLAEQDLVPDKIVSSSAKRALLTAEDVARNSGYEAEIESTRELYMAMPQDYIAVLNQVAESNNLVMVVGHNPGIEELVEQLSGQWYRMPTAALAYFALPIESWRDLVPDARAELINIWRPKELFV